MVINFNSVNLKFWALSLFFILTIVYSVAVCKSDTCNITGELICDSISTDPSYGYPYPAQICWDTLVSNGIWDTRPTKTKNSPLPLIEYHKTEIYRFEMFPNMFTIHISPDTPSVILEHIDVIKWKETGPWSFPDSVTISKYQVKLNQKQTNTVKKALVESHFWDKSLFDEYICDDGNVCIMEGIKNIKYKIITRGCISDDHERSLLKLNNVLLLIFDLKTMKE